MMSVSGYVQDVLLPQSHNIGGLFDGVMAPGGDENDPPLETVVFQSPVDPGHADTGEITVRGEGLFPCHHEGREVREGAVRGHVAQGDPRILDVSLIKPFRLAVDEPMQPGHQLPFHEAGGLCGLYLDLILVQCRNDHLQENHEIGNGTDHVPDVVGIPHLDRMGNYVFFDLRQYILDEAGAVRDCGLIEYPAQIRKADAAVNAALFLEKIMDHFKELLSELDKLVR